MQIKPLRVRTGILVGALAAGIVAGSFGLRAAIAKTSDNSSTPNPGIILTPSLRPGDSNQNQPPAPVFPRNESCQTYGSGSNGTPDLISAIGVDGTYGYVRAVDLRGEMPKTPEEALAQQNNRKPGSIRQIPLYAVDGKTVIGEFNIAN